jgi:hypothetical protein
LKAVFEYKEYDNLDDLLNLRINYELVKERHLHSFEYFLMNLFIDIPEYLAMFYIFSFQMDYFSLLL